MALEPDNGTAMSIIVAALAALGETERAKEWAERAMLLDPENMNLRYNVACTLVLELREFDAALDLLEPVFKQVRIDSVNWAHSCPARRALPNGPALHCRGVAGADGERRTLGVRLTAGLGRMR